MSKEEILKEHGLPALDGAVLEIRYRAGNGDWHARTKDGWFYCRTENVARERWQWVPSTYGPTT